MYQALYRKYRPKDFNSVVGQDMVVKTLLNSVVNKTFTHAYMFFGPRGTGKTTVSKIFARNINCLSPKNGIACEKCAACKVSFSKDCIDIIEIDAASNNGVDEIRDLKNKISLVPSELKYKVYIIDEVHMLSIGAFNALLKTLEEPPEHAIFILATTDPQKVPDTIVSRCQCFSFNKISSEIITKRLVEICNLEKIDIDNDVLSNISLLSGGGLRDALGMLDKVISYSNGKITMSDFAEVNSIIIEEQLIDFLDSICTGNISKLLCILDEFDSKGKNLVQILVQLLNYIRNIIVDYYVKAENKFKYSINLLLDLASYINENMFDIKKSENIRICVEIFLLKFIDNKVLSINGTYNNYDNETLSEQNFVVEKEKFNTSVDLVETPVVAQVDVLDDKSNINHINTGDRRILNILDIMKVRINNTLAGANKQLLKDEIEKFEKLKDYTFDQKLGYIVCALLDSKVRVVSKDSIIISFDYDSTVEQNLNILNKLSDTYNKITESNKLIAIVSDAEWEIIKNKYINDIKNGIKYEFQKEPEVIFEDFGKDDIISNNAIDLFGDIVEFE